MAGLVDMDNRCLAKRKMPVYKNEDHNTVIRKNIGVGAGILGLIGAANLI